MDHICKLNYKLHVMWQKIGVEVGKLQVLFHVEGKWKKFTYICK